MNKNKYVFLTALLIFICCIGAASAADDISDDSLTIDDEAVVAEQVDDVDLQSVESDDATLEVNDVENENLRATSVTVTNWSQLAGNASSSGDKTINLASGVTYTYNTNDTAYLMGAKTFKGNTFTNSPQTQYDPSNTYNNVVMPLTPSKLGAVLGVASMDLIGGSESTIFVNSSCDHDYDDDDEMDGSSWKTALGTDDPLQWIPELTKVVGIDNIINIKMANGEYTDLGDFPTNINYIGFGDNVIIKTNSIGQKSKTDTKYNYTFKNLIFENTISFEGRHFTFINCTFKNVNLDFYKQIENENFMQKFDVDSDAIDVRPLFDVNFDNCRFIDCNNAQIIDAHKYSNLTITNCNFTNCNVDSLVSTNANYTYSDNENEIYKYEKGIKDGVNIVNINVSDSTFKGVLKAQNDTNYIVEKVTGFTPTALIVEDGNYIYLNATDVKSVVETKLNINSSEKGIVIINLTDVEGNPVVNVEVKYNNGGENITSTTNVDGSVIVSGLTGEGEIKAYFEGNDSYLKSENSFKYNFTESAPTTNGTSTNSTGNATSGNGTSTNSTGNATSGNGTSTNTGKTNTDTNKQTTTKKVTKKATKITASKKTFKAKTKTKKYTITLKAGKTAVKKVKVTIKIGKKTYKATTNSKGKATFKITKLTKKGKYTAVIKFAGNKNYKATSKKVKITVKK